MEGHLRNAGWIGRLALSAGCAASVMLTGCGLGGVNQHAGDMRAAAVNAQHQLTTGVKTLQQKISANSSEIPGPDIVNINYASLEKLASLPGISKAQARKIMNNRPYNTPLDMVYKHVVTQAEYERIAKRVDA